MSHTIPVAEAQGRLPELVSRVARSGDRLVVDAGDDQAVLVGIESLEALELLADPAVVADIREALESIRRGDTERLEDAYPREV